MVSKAVNLILRGAEFVFILLIMALVGNIIATAFAGNPSLINYDIFVAVFGMLSLFYLIAIELNSSFTGPGIVPVVVDVLNVIFLFCAAVAMAAELGVHSCSNESYTTTNHITNGSPDTKGRCREAQATTAFLWFAWAAWTVSLVFTLANARGSNVDLRRSLRSRGTAPPMSQSRV